MKYKFLFSLALTMSLVSSQVSAQATIPAPGDADYVVNTKAHVGSYNLILKNDLDTTSDIEGRLFVGGNVNLAGKSLDLGSNISAAPVVDAVTIVGDINANDIKTQNGNIVYGGNSGSTTFLNNGSGTTSQVDQVALEAQFNNVWDQVVSDSQHFKTLASTGVFDHSNNNQKYLEDSSATDLTVYNISYADILSGDVLFRNPPTVPIVINVDATKADPLDTSKDLVLNSKTGFSVEDFGHLVLWNFYNATSIAFNGDGWHGSVLAPNATISSSTGALEGGFAALSYTGQVELHNDLYTYNPPSTPPKDVPAPASALIMALGLAFMVRRKLTK